MKVIFTDQSLLSLQETLDFAHNSGLSPEKVLELRNRLLDRADSLQLNPYKGQREPYLAHLNEGHRRIIEGNFKIIYK